MPFFDRVKEFAVSAAQSANEKLEVASVNESINKEEAELKKIFAKIGKKVYDEYKQGLVRDGEMIVLCEKASSIQNVIDEFKNERLNIKNMKVCSACGAELDKEDVFCSSCGEKQEIVLEKDDEMKVEMEEE